MNRQVAIGRGCAVTTIVEPFSRLAIGVVHVSSDATSCGCWKRVERLTIARIREVNCIELPRPGRPTNTRPFRLSLLGYRVACPDFRRLFAECSEMEEEMPPVL